MRNKTRRLTESAMLLAIAIVLEVISKQFIPEFPFGGQITFVSMLPVILISYRHGLKWGFFSAFVYSLLEMVLGAGTISAAFRPGYFGDGAMLWNALLMCFLDYLLAFTVLGLGGLFRNKDMSPSLKLCLGAAVAIACRYAAHVLSGCILFSSYAEWYFTQESFPFQTWGANLIANLKPSALAFVYSLVYNGMYMLPELVATSLAAFFLGKVPKIAKKAEI